MQLNGQTRLGWVKYKISETSEHYHHHTLTFFLESLFPFLLEQQVETPNAALLLKVIVIVRVILQIPPL